MFESHITVKGTMDIELFKEVCGKLHAKAVLIELGNDFSFFRLIESSRFGLVWFGLVWFCIRKTTKEDSNRRPSPHSHTSITDKGKTPEQLMSGRWHVGSFENVSSQVQSTSNWEFGLSQSSITNIEVLLFFSFSSFTSLSLL